MFVDTSEESHCLYHVFIMKVIGSSQLSDMYGITSQGTLFFSENKAAFMNTCCFQQITTTSKQQSVSSEADSKFSTFHGIWKFITLFNQIHMHPHHLKMVPFNTILRIPLDFPNRRSSRLSTSLTNYNTQNTGILLKKILPAVPF